ncbi:hypothetical protein [Ferroplasma acidarmanus]|uniref:Uncharacterized protein n=1 Tax=Ferroplasma acidarmanus Fer1 TaxID=333146 RepID=S0ARX7_FERAC|nr:hypothetical protein [Ferroplasma acidarmanus]AGO60860.1 hypothetical protein FACI_IFERC00001G0880 [Ferroplasma acidarmanus Fer1]
MIKFIDNRGVYIYTKLHTQPTNFERRDDFCSGSMKSRKQLEAKDEKTINLAIGMMYICSRDKNKIVNVMVIPMNIAGIMLFLSRTILLPGFSIENRYVNSLSTCCLIFIF